MPKAQAESTVGRERWIAMAGNEPIGPALKRNLYAHVIADERRLL